MFCSYGSVQDVPPDAVRSMLLVSRTSAAVRSNRCSVRQALLAFYSAKGNSFRVEVLGAEIDHPLVSPHGAL